MSIFGSLFGGKKQSSDGLPPEVAQIFEKIAQMMENEDLQNSKYHLSIKSQVVDGLNVDELPNAVGGFGRSENNPIPVNGPIGELIYLSSLETEGGQRILYHRLGSTDGIDIYETVSFDGKIWDVLFFSMYHPRKSNKVPSGYSIVALRDRALLFGTNRLVDKFPYGLQEAIKNTTEEIFGIPMPPPQVRQAEESIQFQRPDNHEDQIRSLVAGIDGFRGEHE